MIAIHAAADARRSHSPHDSMRDPSPNASNKTDLRHPYRKSTAMSRATRACLPATLRAMALIGMMMPPSTSADDLMAAKRAPNGKPWNVLMVAFDDLNDYPSILANYPGIKTPNLDAFAATSLNFSRACTPATACQPARTAIMSGLAPWRSGVYDNSDKWRSSPALKGIRTLPHVFRESGWYTMTNGKILHETNGPMKQEYERMWDDQGIRGRYAPKPKSNPLEQMGIPAYRSFGVAEENTISDFQTATQTERNLAKAYDKPFFLAHGIYYPHVPLTVPQRFLDLYPEDQMIFPPPGYRDDDLDDVPAAAKTDTSMMDWHQKMKDAGLWKAFTRHYLASVSAADELLGRVIGALDKSPHKDNTIVVVWADHGYHLGEKARIAKYTVWERTAHVTFLVRVPGMTTGGAVCERPVNLQDIYPTLVELCDLQAPGHELSGRSLAPLLAQPTTAWPYPSITCHTASVYGARNEQFRYITYGAGQEELYDLANDPHEFTNLADQPASAEVKASLSAAITHATANAITRRPRQTSPIPEESAHE